MRNKKHLLIRLLGLLGIITIVGCHYSVPLSFRQETTEERTARRIERAVDKLTRELDLNSEQKKRVRIMAETICEKAIDLQKGHAESKTEFLTLLSQDNVAAAEVQGLITKKMERFKPMVALFATQMAEFHEILTPEQRKRLIEKVEEHKHRGCRFSGRW